jgi:hypothetical protein
VTGPGWSTPADVRSKIQRHWQAGRILADVAQAGALFPLRVTLKGPSSTELGSRFEDLRAWVTELQSVKQGRLELREINHRQLGPNTIPLAVWFDSADAACATIGTSRDLQRFRSLVALTESRCSELLAVLIRRPLDALAEADAWPVLLDIVEWLRAHPRPGIYVRQVDVPGVHTKFIEQHRRMLGAMLELVLPESAIDPTAGTNDFVRRYGFAPRPRIIRFRALDPELRLASRDVDFQYSLTAADFGRIEPPKRVFITENEINFLAFPDSPGAMVVFGAGSGFDHLPHVPWLADVPVHYWGDIDTHGMAILDQLRGFAPHAESLMMDSETLMMHQGFWGTEDTPTTRDLGRLTHAELALYDDLRDNRIRANLRLEQERIRFGWVRSQVAQATQT